MKPEDNKDNKENKENQENQLPEEVHEGGASASETAAARPPEVDPFNPKNYRKVQDPRLNPGADPATSGLPNSIEARKPKKAWYFRIHSDPAYRATLPLYTDEDSKRRDDSYLFAPGLEIPADLEDIVRDNIVAAAITNT